MYSPGSYKQRLIADRVMDSHPQLSILSFQISALILFIYSMESICLFKEVFLNAYDVSDSNKMLEHTGLDNVDTGTVLSK